MRRVIVVLSLVLLGLPIGETAAASPLVEGQKGWDCRTMGNRTCSPGMRVAELAGILEGQPGWDCRTMGNGVCGSTLSSTDNLASVVLEPASVGTTERVNVSSDEEQANGPTPIEAVDVSRNGRFVAFLSQATNLVPGDTNGLPDLFVRDRLLGTTERVNVSSAGAQANGISGSGPTISSDGRFVAFASLASNLVEGDTNLHPDVFVHDRRLDTTRRISVGPLGIEANGASAEPDISENGQVIAFASNATNLTADEAVLHAADPVADASEIVVTGVLGDIAETDNFADVFVHDLGAGITERISVNDLGSPASGPDCDPELCPPAGQPYSDDPSISADGRYVAFESNAANLVVDVPLFPSVAPWPVDDNEAADIYVRDRLLRRTEWISVSESWSGGVNPAISGTGRYVAFGTENDDGVFLRDRSSDVIEQVDVDSDEDPSTTFSYRPSISDSGQNVAFASLAKLAPEDLSSRHDVYLRNRRAGTTTLESVNSAGVQANNGTATLVAVSGDGRAVLFLSGSTNLVDNDTNGLFDIFVHVH